MTDFETSAENASTNVAKLPLFAAVVALIGLADAVYLTIKHYTGAAVPCSIVEGCEQVLTSSYAEISGIPLAMFGAVAYFVAFCLAILTAFGNRRMWALLGVQISLMMIFTVWLIYLQAYVIGAFCQFCLLSALTTTIMFVIYFVSRYFRRQ